MHDANAAQSAAERKNAKVTALRESLCVDASDTIEMRLPVTEPVKSPERWIKSAASTKPPAKDKRAHAAATCMLRIFSSGGGGGESGRWKSSSASGERGRPIAFGMSIPSENRAPIR
jgi:hypothetical protein